MGAVAGFLKSLGGCKKFKDSVGFGGLDPTELMKKVVDAEILEKLKDQADEAESMLEEFKARAEAVLETWLSEQGGQKLLDKAGVNPKKLAKVEVPTAEFTKAGLAAAVELLRLKLEEIGGSVAERLEAISMTVEQRSTDMRRGLDQLLQELVVSKAREDVFPELQTRMKDLRLRGMPLPGKIFDKVASLVFDLAEGEVRKQVHAKVAEFYTAASAGLVPAGCGVAAEAGEVLPEDEYGFLSSDGGYAAFKGSSGFGGLGGALGVDPSALMKQVLDEEMSEKLKMQVEEAKAMLASYKAHIDSAHSKWLAEGGKKLLKKPGGNPKNIAQIQLKAAEVQKAGLAAAVELLRPKLEEIGGSVAERLEAISVTVEQRSTDMRRGLDQLLQELVVSKAHENVFPELHVRLTALKLPGGLPLAGKIMDKVSGRVFDLAEGEVRKQVHVLVAEAYTAAGAKFAPADGTVIKEKGKEKAEDIYGFLASEGGYKKFKGSSGFGALGLDPTNHVKKVVDPAMVEKLKQQAVEADLMLAEFKAKADAVLETWLAEEGGQARLDKAAGNPKKLAKVKVPTAEFAKAGLAAAMELLRPKLEALGGAAAERMQSISMTADQRSTDMRRGLGQLLQELVLAKARESVFPELETRIKGITLPGGIPLAGGVMEKVSGLVFDMAEGEVRKEVHAKMAEAYAAASGDLVPAGCGVAPEAGVEAPEDEYGFIASEGGYEKSKGSLALPSAGGITAEPLDLSERVRGGGSADEGKFDNPVIAGEGGEEEPEEEPEEEDPAEDMSNSELKALAKQVKKPLLFDKTLLDDNAVHMVKRYREIGDIVDKRSQVKITKGMKTPEIKGMLDVALQELIFSKMAIALDPEVKKILDLLKYIPEGEDLETVLPDLFKRILTAGIENVTEGAVRDQIHKLVDACFQKVQQAFKATVPGLDAADLIPDVPDSLEDLADGIDGEDGDDDEGGGGGGGFGRLGLGLAESMTGISDIAGMDVESMRHLREVLDPSLMNRVMYQLKQVTDLLAIYSTKATEAQMDWFHMSGKHAIAEAKHAYGDMHYQKPKKKKKKTKKGQAAVAEVKSVLKKVPIPIYEFQKVGLIGAARELEERIGSLSSKDPKSAVAMQQSVETVFSDRPVDEGGQVASVMRDTFDELAQLFVLAHAGMAIDPEVKRRLEETGLEAEKAAELESKVQEQIERMLREGTHKQIKGAYDQLGHTMVVPGTEVELEPGDTDEKIGSCKMCGKELRIYDQTHPDYVSYGPLDSWNCDVCAKTFGADEQLFCCDTFEACDWGACATCQLKFVPGADDEEDEADAGAVRVDKQVRAPHSVGSPADKGLPVHGRGAWADFTLKSAHCFTIECRCSFTPLPRQIRPSGRCYSCCLAMLAIRLQLCRANQQLVSMMDGDMDELDTFEMTDNPLSAIVSSLDEDGIGSLSKKKKAKLAKQAAKDAKKAEQRKAKAAAGDGFVLPASPCRDPAAASSLQC